MLRSLCDLSVSFEQIGTLQGLEAKIVIAKVTIIDYGRVQPCGVLLNHIVVKLGYQGHFLIRLLVYMIIQILEDV